MLIARWRIDARFGHKQQVIEALRAWASDIAPQIGLRSERGQILSGSVGALEATVEHNWAVDSLAELEAGWAKLGAMEAHRSWGQNLEAHVVSGTSRWEVYRLA